MAKSVKGATGAEDTARRRIVDALMALLAEKSFEQISLSTLR